MLCLNYGHMNLESRLLLLPLTARYAVSAVAHLSTVDGSRFRMTADIARATRLPSSYLAKILQRLSHSGLLESRPGVHGGYRLGAGSAGLTLASVVAAATGDGAKALPCMIEARDCDARKPCAMHRLVDATERMLWKRLGRTTLHEFSRLHASSPARPRRKELS